MLPGDLGQLAQGVQFGELGRVVGVGDRAGPQPVAQGDGHVVAGHQLAKLVEPRVEEILGVMRQAPLGQDGAAAGDDARHPPRSQRDVTQEHAGVDREVIDALLGLFLEGLVETSKFKSSALPPTFSRAW